MSISVNKIGKGFSPEPYHHPNGFIKLGEKVPTIDANGRKKARAMLVPPMEKILKERESKAGDQ